MSRKISGLGIYLLIAFKWAIFLYGNLEGDSLDDQSFDAQNLLDEDC